MDVLRVEGLYRNTQDWKQEADQFNKFFRFTDAKGRTSGINNVAGFRAKSKAGSTNILNCAFCVLVTNLGELEWPDDLDRESGVFTYYGDNRSPGHSIEDTALGGNRLLAAVFSKLHEGKRDEVVPFLCFESVKAPGPSHMRFLGLACPGGAGISATEDLVGVWRVTGGRRFQNYRALFSILNADSIPKAWLEDLVNGQSPADSKHCPKVWRNWVKTGAYRNLTCEPEQQPRRKLEQLPASAAEWAVLRRVHQALSPREFEFAALELTKLLDSRFVDLQVTRPSRDGGRDVVGKYVIGHKMHRVGLNVLVEAKRWDLESAVGTRPMMRLISRIKHRDLGVFVTTGVFDTQVQQELIDDGHPVLLVSGGDIAKLLISRDLASGDQLESWLAGVKHSAGNAGGIEAAQGAGGWKEAA
ncbi:restriction endonuclease [Ramlibacter solisilvae]|uniref:restriction endonuclease n=1 Tax=Ramlibacter tataouinensis TaxID=94132 RepID=UPI0009EE2CDF|nr:restriction endonuclease [Ramlibacter tataouinensis]